MKLFKTCLLASALLAIWLAAPLTHGQTPGITFTALAAFNNTTNGANPYAPPVLGADGNLYGVLPFGSTNNAGVIYQVTTNATQTTFHAFDIWDGTIAVAAMVAGRDGKLYGVASGGGTNNQGTIFEITTNGAFTLLYSFGMVTNNLGYALDGSKPYGGMVQGRDGNFYGVTYNGGVSNVGTVFRFSTNGTLTTLHSFTGNGSDHAGAYPYTAPLVEVADGIFYGTTSAGGTNNAGTIFQITANGTLTNLHEFNKTDGLNPYAGLSLGMNGKLYGTTVYGGTNNSHGTAFQITTNGVLTTLFQFGGTDGLLYPEGGVVPGNNNTLFGTTYAGGAQNYGTVFQLTTNGLLTTLYSFASGNDGAQPYAGVIRDASGNLYGTTLYGGNQGGYGTVYRLSFTALVSILSPTANEFWTNSVFPVTGTASDNAAGGVITNVFYSLNGAGWTNAATTNGWINWTGSVMPAAASAVLTVTTNGLGSLSPDDNGAALQAANTNSIAAYAVDNNGNVSATNTVSFVYGRSYAITATARAGFVFTNWTGGTSLPLSLITNGPTIQFVMASNLMLQANFMNLTKPTLSITNVSAGMSVSSAVFTVKGKAGDNWQLANVRYSLNSGGWSNAVTGNNWTNWSALVTLSPGTNTIAAYAVDPGGQPSLTNSVSLQYLVTNQLQIRAIGLGTISPNYSNAWLQIGANYSVKATPATGFAFTNWTGGTSLPLSFITNGPTIQFVMASNLMLQANFVDVAKPTINIIAPASGQHMTNALATVAGTAGDNWKVAGVWYQLNSGMWSQPVSTNGWTNWTTTVELQAATNTLSAYAQDLGGNFSTTTTVSFVSSNAFKLQLFLPSGQPLATNGFNFTLQISPGLNGHIQGSTNFADWVMLTNFAGTNTTLNFRDPAATNLGQRYYRATIP